jgi:hypothetical protein
METTRDSQDDQLKKDVLRRHRDEDMRDDDVIINESLSDSKLPANGDEMPEEHQVGNEEVNYQKQGELEKGSDNEVTFRPGKEVKQPNPEHEPHERKATLNTLDPSFVGIDHGRSTGRMIDHEPGTPNNL